MPCIEGHKHIGLCIKYIGGTLSPRLIKADFKEVLLCLKNVRRLNSAHRILF